MALAEVGVFFPKYVFGFIFTDIRREIALASKLSSNERTRLSNTAAPPLRACIRDDQRATIAGGMARRLRSRRGQRRAHERERAKLERDLERLAKLQPGGAPDRPIVVGAPPQVDIIAQRTRCPVCQTTLRLEQHEAATVDGAPLRIARTFCAVCGTKRPLYFRLDAESVH